MHREAQLSVWPSARSSWARRVRIRISVTESSREDILDCGGRVGEVDEPVRVSLTVSLRYQDFCKKKELEAVVIASDSIMEDVYDGKRCLYLLFNRRWAEEDLNDNGVGIRLLGEEIDGTRYKDIAF